MKKILGILLISCIAFHANAQLLWKISGNGLEKPSYIIGTHHFAPLSIKDKISGLSKAMDETQQVYGEIKMTNMQSPEIMQAMQKMMMISNDTTISSLFTPEDYEVVNKFCQENLMLDLAAVPKLKPAFIQNNIIVVAYMKHVGNFNPQEQLDLYFQTQAVQKGKKAEGLETAESQFNMLFNGTSLQRQAETLMCTLNTIDKGIEQLKRITDAYMNQDLNAILKISEEKENDQCDMRPDEKDIMIYNRNKTWVEKLPAIMKEAPTFVVVGALHLPGDKGVLNLLKKQGYTVEAVQ